LGSAKTDHFLRTFTLNEDGGFAFESVPGNATYWLKYEGKGYRTVPAIEHVFGNCRGDWNDAAWSLQPAPGARDRRRHLQGANSSSAGGFRFSWAMDPSRAGFSETANVVVPPVVELAGGTAELLDDQAAFKLTFEFGVVLTSASGLWSEEYSYRLLETLRTVPMASGARDMYRTPFDMSTAPLRSSWSIVDSALPQDIEIQEDATGFRTVTVSSDAFTYASPQTVRIDGIVGKYFSKRLYHAVVRFVTRDGSDYGAIEHIFTTRFSCASIVDGPTVEVLTAPYTGETNAHFQPFSDHPEEALLVLSMFEEMPNGLHKIPGLSYLLRRADGLPHPLYPAAPAVAWANPGSDSYIEWMETGFT
jgi:hypothetical protein